VSLATLFPHAGIELDQMSAHRKVAHDRVPATNDDGATGLPDPVPPGSYESAVVVLLSDGQNTTGVDPVEAAQLAARLGVKVFTVGFGTENGDVVVFGGWSVRVHLDEETLKQIASITHGSYFNAATARELDGAYKAMTSRL